MRSLFPLDRDCEDHVYCVFEFPGPDYESDPNKKIGVVYTSINGNGFGGYGETVLGTEGTLILEREQDVMLFSSNAATTTNLTVAKGGKGGPTLDTTQSGGGEAVVGKQALVRPGQPRLHRRARALGLVHPQSRPRRTSRAAIPRWPWATP